jgi:hypothetical protein
MRFTSFLHSVLIILSIVIVLAMADEKEKIKKEINQMMADAEKAKDKVYSNVVKDEESESSARSKYAANAAALEAKAASAARHEADANKRAMKATKKGVLAERRAMKAALEAYKQAKIKARLLAEVSTAVANQAAAVSQNDADDAQKNVDKKEILKDKAAEAEGIATASMQYADRVAEEEFERAKAYAELTRASSDVSEQAWEDARQAQAKVRDAANAEYAASYALQGTSADHSGLDLAGLTDKDLDGDLD